MNHDFYTGRCLTLEASRLIEMRFVLEKTLNVVNVLFSYTKENTSIVCLTTHICNSNIKCCY